MNTENIVAALEKFFFEIIGQLLPGLLLLTGLYYVLPNEFVADFYPTNSLGIWVLVGAAYAIGGAICALGNYYLIPFFLWIMNFRGLFFMLPKRAKKRLVTNDDIDKRIIDSPSFDYIKSKLDLPEGTTLETIRNVAMTNIDQKDKETTIRFMMLSLLSQGVASAIILIAIPILFFGLSKYAAPFQVFLYEAGIVLVTVLAALPFVLREREFFDRARRLPLDAYLAVLKSKKPLEDE